MKISEGIVLLKGREIEIPDVSRDDLPAFFKEMGYKVGAEIGVYKGEFTKKLLDAGLKVYGIDPWGNFVTEKRYPEYRERQQFLYDHVKRTLDKYIKNGQCELIRDISMKAVKRFKNETLDFIYIDANHAFKYITEDLYEWTWRVKKGGVISGHDFYRTASNSTHSVCHVAPVVKAYTEAFGVENWYLLGRRKPQSENEKRDKWLSWMWIKKNNAG